MPEWTPAGLAAVLDQHTGQEAWFCLSRFRAGQVTDKKTGERRDVPDDYKHGDVFAYAVGCAADVDTPDHSTLTYIERREVEHAAKAGAFPGELAYLTPAGFRVVRMFDAPVAEAETLRGIAEAFNAAVERSIQAHPKLSRLRIDPTCRADRARLFYAPNSQAKGITRHADTILLPGTEPPNGAGVKESSDGERELGSAGSSGVDSPTPFHEVQGWPSGLAADVDRAVAATLPASHGTRRACLRRLLTRLKSMPHFARAEVSTLEPIVMEWWRRGREKHRDADGSESWDDVVTLWPRTTGEDAVLAAVERVTAGTSDPFAGKVVQALCVADRAGFRQLMEVLCELDRAAAGAEWFLSVEKAAEVFGISVPTAQRWLRGMLMSQGVVIQTQAPRRAERIAARYRLNRQWPAPPDWGPE